MCNHFNLKSVFVRSNLIPFIFEFLPVIFDPLPHKGLRNLRVCKVLCNQKYNEHYRESISITLKFGFKDELKQETVLIYIYCP